jgi:integrase
MAREIAKLSPAKVQKATKPGMYSDGGGLYLHVGLSGNKSWVYRFMLHGQSRDMGLGSIVEFGLKEARERAQRARQLRRDGVDPIKERNSERDARRLEAAKSITFKACGQKYVAAHRSSWKSAKHADQWESTLEEYVYPVIGALPVSAVDTGHVTKILESIWGTVTETASRVRGRIEVILNYAKTNGWRSGENPAVWRGHLENIFAKKSKVAPVEHHPAMDWKEIGAFMPKLVAKAGVAAAALRFTILTTSRTGEVRFARWPEIDEAAKLWIIPGKRMKAGKEHRVPLSSEAMAILKDMAKLRTDTEGYIFPGRDPKKPLSNRALLIVLDRLGRSDVTTHGFRSTFTDWAAETGRPNDIADAALAHKLGNATRTAYQRGTLLDRRRRLMNDWAAFCGRPFAEGGKVVRLSEKRA